MAKKVTIVCTQNDETGKQLFSVSKTDTVKGKINNFNLTKFIVNVLALSIQMSKLTGTNRPKLSKPITVEYSIGDKKSKLDLKFSLSEKRIEIIEGRMPQIFLTAYRLHGLKFTDKQTYVNTAGELVFYKGEEKAKKTVKKLATEAVEQPAS